MKRMLHHLQCGLLKRVSIGSVPNRQSEAAHQALIDLVVFDLLLSSFAPRKATIGQ
jgi:hypothetical protein